MWTVRVRSEFTYAQEPRALVVDGQEHAITRIIARWRTPAGPAFRVVCDLGEFVVAYDEAHDSWIVSDL